MNQKGKPKKVKEVKQSKEKQTCSRGARNSGY